MKHEDVVKMFHKHEIALRITDENIQEFGREICNKYGMSLYNFAHRRIHTGEIVFLDNENFFNTETYFAPSKIFEGSSSIDDVVNEILKF